MIRNLQQRRHFILSASIGLVAGLCASTAFAQATAKPGAAGRTPVILVLGDSLSAEYGLARGTGWVALLEKQLAQDKLAATVVNASVSGETTSGGRSRLAALLAPAVAALLQEETGTDPQLDAFLALAQQYLHVPA